MHLPEPFTTKAGHGEHSPVDEDAELGLVKPGWQRAAVQRLPRGVVAKGSRGPARPQEQRQQHGQKHREPHAHARQFGVLTEPQVTREGGDVLCRPQRLPSAGLPSSAKCTLLLSPDPGRLGQMTAAVWS